MEIDKRKKCYLVIDVKTTNGLDEPLVYEIGAMIIDNNFNVYQKFSYLIEETFISHSEQESLMNTAYYGWNVPLYAQKIQEGKIKIEKFDTVRSEIHKAMKKYNVTTCVAHNGRFDYEALNTTIRYLTGGRERYYFNYNTDWIYYVKK